MPRTISLQFYYAGCLSSSGERTNLEALRQEARAGFPVTIVELDPGMVSPPWRLYVAGEEHDAEEILQEHCQRFPRGRLARWLGLHEIDDDALAYTPWTIDVSGRRLGPREDYISGIYGVAAPEVIQRSPGGRYAAELARKLPEFSFDLVAEADKCYVYAYLPTWASPSGQSVHIDFPACDLGRNAKAPVAVLQAWKLALTGALEQGLCS